ncbi:MAG TPA: NAD(P)-dependent oxidoreductase [Bryobacteraceae bacterium]|nr:NAD(P)-dependent oxidoreductase [Bryobacteraceae bacterium]
MKIFVVGAAGAVGKRLIPQLLASGREVIAATRTPAKADNLRALGAQPVILDLLDRAAVLNTVISVQPDVLVHQGTSLARVHNLKHFDDRFEMTNRLRTTGTEYLLEAARAAGTRRFIAQSYTGWPNERSGGRVKTETDPFDSNPPGSMRRSLAAIQKLEELVLGAGNLTGIVLRYGNFYGPGTSVAPDGEIVEAVRQRKLPIIGSGAGIWSWIHIDDVVRATLLAIEGAPAGIYNIVDDDPAEVSVWLPYLAQAIGAKPPRRVPEWLGRLVAGEAVVSMMTKIRGASNATAKRVLNWQPLYPTWREGFVRGLNARRTVNKMMVGK